VDVASGERLLGAWERGTSLSPAARALEILAAADAAGTGIADLPVGERDRRLLNLRQALLGPVLDVTMVCPGCQERVEFPLEVASLVVPATATPTLTSIEAEGITVEFRLPTSGDLLALSRPPSVLTESALLNRCVTRVTGEGGVEAGRTDRDQCARPVLSAAVCDAIAAKMAELDPQADLQLNVSCPNCEFQWVSDFDVVAYVWAELTSWVGHLLNDVHQLARAYGWPERDILRLSHRRRQAYLDLVDA
jgi:hypothetical protein